MESARNSAHAGLLDSARLLQLVADSQFEPITRAAILIASALREGKKLLLCGNGGSAADCQHMATEFVGRFSHDLDREGLRAIALTTDSSILTAYANDVSFERVFERQVLTLAEPGDVLLAISTSGRSKNVLLAITAAEKRGAHTVALTGENGLMAQQASIVIAVPSADTQRIQESHLAIEHAICQIVEGILYPR